ncbi:MAG: bifunctional adenosylcobinamide kinase/adenosylcobinamide-phosphate guanylyltransferase [Deltaproteobacteria bacterium]|nr:bifunctional adenosylcobinamide kinase/adenosylcobinamide-phosphate guanylyltransferase [Deltaproteobacteria bacterium]MBN2674512.1 bifunctional adenosylcobinamide kinase/adenosylcobinamide-phosphate guanylyltransferase [Deltaproteobacteria bacterium]
MNDLILITGGARSGKSRYALSLTDSYSSPYFIATAVAFDDEMRHRIALHKQERSERFMSVEAPLDLGDALCRKCSQADIVVVDCLTVWMGNLLHEHGMRSEPFNEVSVFLRALQQRHCPVVTVANELGMGLVPENAMGRWFRDAAGRLNQEVATLATKTMFMVSGYPLTVKGSGIEGKR